MPLPSPRPGRIGGLGTQRAAAGHRQRGFSLAELMIATTLGLIVLAGMATLFVGNSKAQAEIEKANRQIENGRYAIQTLTSDARNAGYLGKFDPRSLTTAVLTADLCATDLPELSSLLRLHVQGVDNAAAGSVSCLPDLKSGTDVLLVRRVETCLPGEGSCEPIESGGVFLQPSLCDNLTQLGSASEGDFYDLHTDVAQLTRRMRDCTSVANSGTLAPYRRLVTNIYYIANNDNPGDAIPTLKRAMLGGLGPTFSVVPLVEGIESMHFLYGVDDAAIPDGVADNFTAAPDDWSSVVSVKLHLLARNIEPTVSYTDNKTYTLGDVVIQGNGDNFKRHVFQALVAMPNPAGRRAP